MKVSPVAPRLRANAARARRAGDDPCFELSRSITARAENVEYRVKRRVVEHGVRRVAAEGLVEAQPFAHLPRRVVGGNKLQPAVLPSVGAGSYTVDGMDVHIVLEQGATRSRVQGDRSGGRGQRPAQRIVGDRIGAHDPGGTPMQDDGFDGLFGS